jgi:hypothetical protein
MAPLYNPVFRNFLDELQDELLLTCTELEESRRQLQEETDVHSDTSAELALLTVQLVEANMKLLNEKKKHERTIFFKYMFFGMALGIFITLHYIMVAKETIPPFWPSGSILLTILYKLGHFSDVFLFITIIFVIYMSPWFIGNWWINSQNSE